MQVHGSRLIQEEYQPGVAPVLITFGALQRLMQIANEWTANFSASLGEGTAKMKASLVLR